MEEFFLPRFGYKFKYKREKKTENVQIVIIDGEKIGSLFWHARLAHHSVAFTSYQILFHIIIHWNFVCSLTANKKQSADQPNIINKR